MTLPNGFKPVDRGNDGIPEVGVGMLGYRFMGKAHSNAYHRMPVFFWPPVARPRLIAMCGRTESAVAEAALRYGYEGYYLDLDEMLADPRIQLFDNCASANAHAEPTLAAIKAGKHVICEKPLALTAADARAMWQAAEEAGVKHMTGFNYRFVPAVRFVRDIIDEGILGEIYQFRGRYLQEGGDDPNRPYSWRHDRSQGGYGALGDIGVHIIDLARYLAGEIVLVSAMTATYVKERPLADQPDQKRSVTVDDAFVSAVRFANGAVGTIEASKVATGRKNQNTFEINGSRGSVVFDLERLNELQVYLKYDTPDRLQGFGQVLVSERNHPYVGLWWPHGHIIGWEHSFVHEVEAMMRAIVNDDPIAPYGATFEDGYRALAVAEAVLESADNGRQVEISY
ncbi:MAG TPA: Gfo/Idh/MocA family oxidoreductase [Chloroflexi bacterium]|jgi:predicted dehydrogenase|nr:Gfo/Idh/MocA family oxidoreductase [Chloroflexota bacterium]